MDELYTLLLLFPSVFLLSRMIKWVRPGGVQLLYAPGGKIRRLEAGIHLLPHPFYSRLSGPFSGLVFSDHDAPATGTRVVINPPPVSVQSSDSVSAVVDVACETLVLPWTVESFVRAQKVSLKNLAATRINQWVSRLVGRLHAQEITYVRCMSELNTTAALGELNEELRDCLLTVQRVNIDPKGVVLSPTFTTNRTSANSRLQKIAAERDAMKSQLEVARLEHEKAREREVASAARKRIEAEAAASRREIEAQGSLAVAKLTRQIELQRLGAEKERVSALLQAGLDPKDVANLLVVEASAGMLRDSNASKIVAVPPGILGLHGIGAVGASTTTAGGDFVSVQ